MTKHKKHQQSKAKSKPKAANPHLFLEPASDPSWSAGPAPRGAASVIILCGELVLLSPAAALHVRHLGSARKDWHFCTYLQSQRTFSRNFTFLL